MRLTACRGSSTNLNVMVFMKKKILINFEVNFFLVVEIM